jgi:cholesterol 7-dehydrogenase
LNYLHTPIFLSGANLNTYQTWKWAFAKHKWDASWSPCEAPEKHCSILNLKAMMTFLGYNIPFFHFDFQVKQIGPGIVHLPFLCPFGRGVIVQSLTPIEPMIQRINHQMFVENLVPTVVGKFMLWVESIQVERDITVWNNKSYVAKPLLLKEDQLIAKHRRWFSQFYSEHSLRYTKEKSSLDW